MSVNLQIIETKDGSHTLYSPRFDEIYHSRNGAIGESQHIFLRSGLDVINKGVIDVFEVGFGTGLNAFLSWIHAESAQIRINYESIELYPLGPEIYSQINYPQFISGHQGKFDRIHQVDWDKNIGLSDQFSLHKIKGSVTSLDFPSATADIIFFDAFSPDKQPELWTLEIFQKMYSILRPGGILVTYCSKSAVRRNMQVAGFTISKLPGPPGKRDMVRASKF